MSSLKNKQNENPAINTNLPPIPPLPPNKHNYLCKKVIGEREGGRGGGRGREREKDGEIERCRRGILKEFLGERVGVGGYTMIKRQDL